MADEIKTFLQDRPEYSDSRPQWTIIGVDRKVMADTYYFLIAASWGQLLGLAFGGFVLINLLFAVLYFFDLEGVANARPGSFSDAFFFSVQTFSTIGFGAMSPQTVYTHMLVTLESFAGLIAVALATGLIFAKFARPKAAVTFSKNILIHNRDGIPHLHFRIANERLSEIYNMSVNLSVLVDEITSEGHHMRRIRRLHLAREDVPLFTANWLNMHKLDEDSPLYGLTQENVYERALMFIVTIDGVEATLMQTVQASYFYRPSDVRFGYRFGDMITFDDRGMILDQANLNVIEKV